jgi:hypothetical protein
MLGILRNRAYVGEVFFRESRHPSTTPFIDPALFDQVQTILDRRGEDYARRNTDTHPDYLLSGLITCDLPVLRVLDPQPLRQDGVHRGTHPG